MAEVTVDATWRMSRVEFNTPYEPTGTIVGFGEVLLQAPSSPSPEAASILRPRHQGASGKTYGTMQGATVTRVLADVLDQEIDIEGVGKVSFSQAMAAMEKFLQTWLVEDEQKPEVGRVPQTEELTPVAVLGPPPPMGDELPPPIDPFEQLPEPTPPVEVEPHRNNKRKR